MHTLITMLPIYILGNFHCIGMCGPLVMMIGNHHYRNLYFLGRLCSFSLAGLFAGEMGSIINLTLQRYHISSAASLLFGSIIIALGTCQLLGWRMPGHQWFSKKTHSMNKNLSLLILKDSPYATFLFGFFTVLLPCGQTLIVFSACALTGSALTGLINGFAFALLTSPSLFLAMRAHQWMKGLQGHYSQLLGVLALFVGILAVCRGLAELEMISHLVINKNYHIVIY